jgi:hypothetical protein
LSNLERLYANDCTVTANPHDHLPIQWPFPDLTSNLRAIEFLECFIEDKSLSNLLARPPNLVPFKYSHQTRYYNRFQHILPNWDAGAFVAAIGKHCGHQLTALAINIHRLTGKIITGVVSMKEFTRLESAELDVLVFAGPSSEPGERFETQNCDAPQLYKSRTPALVPNLTEILPPSLRRLQLRQATVSRAALVTYVSNAVPSATTLSSTPPFRPHHPFVQQNFIFAIVNATTSITHNTPNNRVDH